MLRDRGRIDFLKKNVIFPFCAKSYGSIYYCRHVQKEFSLKYRPGKCLSFNQGCCGFRGRVNFLTYNKDKPQKWAIKLFEVADAKNGFVCGFDVYCGKNETSCAKNATVLDPQCTQTTKTVVGLLDSVQLLDKGHFVYLDNFYNSYELNLELLA